MISLVKYTSFGWRLPLVIMLVGAVALGFFRHRKNVDGKIRSRYTKVTFVYYGTLCGIVSIALMFLKRFNAFIERFGQNEPKILGAVIMIIGLAIIYGSIPYYISLASDKIKTFVLKKMSKKSLGKLPKGYRPIE